MTTNISSVLLYSKRKIIRIKNFPSFIYNAKDKIYWLCGQK